MSYCIDRRLQSTLRTCALGLGLMGCLGAAASAAADVPCKAVFDAITRLVTTPNQQYLQQASSAPGSTAHSSEMISTGKKTYILVDGKWHSSPVTPEETLKRDEENRKNSKTTCRLLREEPVDGAAATVYSLQSQSEFGQSEGQIWISKASALPLRQQIDLTVSGTPGKTHIETRFVYTGVAAPAGVQ